MRRQASAKISIVVTVPPELRVRGAHDELQQVLLNLYLNARDAMPNGGRFAIDGRAVQLDAGSALALQLPGAGAYIELVISDTGAGMDEATLARVFEPFFTTKPIGKGTGLGLAMVHGIVRRHGGAIGVTSQPGRGTAFTIHLPSQ
jgi:signal transduction histidine kinase